MGVNRFWMLGFLDDAGKLKELKHKQYREESDARANAEEMARANTHTRIVVLEAIDTVRKSDICWEPCYHNLPF